MADLTKLVEMSNKHGSNPDLVLAGGGNTSYKENGVLYVKCSGTSLGTITEAGFVAMEIAKLQALMVKKYPEGDAEREAAFLADVMDARCDEDKSKRPSVEALLHSLFPHPYVLHIHPALINGLTCGQGGEKLAREILGDQIIWIPICRPGYILGKLCKEAMDQFKAKNGREAQVVLLQNHGIFIGGGTTEEIDGILADVIEKLMAHVEMAGKEAIVSELEAQTGLTARALVIREADYFVSCKEHAQQLLKPFTPDHIVYCGAYPLFVEEGQSIKTAIEQYKEANGILPKIVLVENAGAFAVGASQKEIQNAGMLLADAMKVAYYAKRFGGILPMTEDLTHFITHWEAESYRKKQA